MIRAYEYRHFFDVIQEIENVADDPEALVKLLSHLNDWNALESRAILEIIKGRLAILEKCRSLVLDDAPETASSKSMDNLHDMLAGSPWIMNPEWQVLDEEKTITKQLREWGYEKVTDEDRQRYDFIGLKGDGRWGVIEIKRQGHPLSLSELARLEEYRNKLNRVNLGDSFMTLIYGGATDDSVIPATLENWRTRADGELITWAEVFNRAKNHYEHYRAVLEGNVTDEHFYKKQTEIAQTRSVLEKGSVHRDKAARRKGLGNQDVDYTDAAPQKIREALEQRRQKKKK